MKTLLWSLLIGALLLVAAIPALGQGQPPKPPTPQGPGFPGPVGPPVDQSNWQTQVFQIQYAQLNEISMLLDAFGVVVRGQPALKALAVRAPKEVLPAIADVIKRFDVPRPASAPNGVSLTVYLVLASERPSDNEPMPAPLRPVLDQLRNVLSYRSYRLIDTAIVRGTEGQPIRTEGVLAKLSTEDANSPTYLFMTVPSISSDAGGRQMIRLRELLLRLNVELPARGGRKEMTITTDVDIQAGQQVVVGKATVVDQAFILVISATLTP